MNSEWAFIIAVALGVAVVLVIITENMELREKIKKFKISSTKNT